MKFPKNCPCCKSSFDEEVYFRKFPFKISGEWKTKKGSLKHCSSCGHLYCNYLLDYEELDSHYENKDSPSLGFVSDADKKELKTIINLMLNHLDKNNKPKCIEIGPGDGTFIDILKEKGWDTFFYDKSIDVTNKLEERHKKVILNDNYNLIILRHILEHISEPEVFLLEIKENYMNNDSILHIEVPCWDFIDDDTDPLMCEHIHQFTSKSLMGLLDRLGLKVVHFNIRKNPEYSTTPNWRVLINCKKFIKSKCNNSLSYVEDYYHSRDDKILKILEDNREESFILHGASSQLGDLIINNNNLLKDRDFIVVDGNKNRIGEDFFDYKIKFPTKILAKSFNTILCFSSFSYQIEKTWRDLGFKGKFYIVWK